MLGALLHSFNPAKQRLQRLPLDSQTEDAHTKSLLFPDAHLLTQPGSLSDSLPGDLPFVAANANSLTDCGAGDIDLEGYRDVRILIAQNYTGQQEQAVLFDSWPAARPDSPILPTAIPTTERAPRSPATAPSSRRSSVVSHDSGRRSPSSQNAAGAFHRNRHRNASLSTPLPFIDETAQARHRESEDMVKTALDCMFENAQSSYKGTSNRIHIVPLEARPNETVLSSPTFADGPQSYSAMGRASGQRRSNLAKSYTPGETAPELNGSDGTRTPRTFGKDHRRRTILISRTFSVPLLEESDTGSSSNEPTPTASNPDPDSTGYPFPKTSAPSKLRIMPSQGRSHTLPMYGISIVIQLPVASMSNPSRRTQSGYFPGAPQGTESMGSSLGSEGKIGGWSFVESMLGVQSFMSESFSSDVDDRVDLVGQHWDIISRSLTALQFISQEKILALLKPQLRAFRPQLQAGALTGDEKVKHLADSTARRIVRGFKIPRVRTGQGRWGVWREEMIWLSRWTASRGQNVFIQNLLAGFLSQHTDWMRVLGPKQYRRRYRELQSTKPNDDLTVPSRTIIITENKMAARRLVFVLSAFLPTSTQSHEMSSPLRPGTAASLRAYSQSPPNITGLVRQESLRRTINRRAQQSSSRTRYPAGRGSQGASGSESIEDRMFFGNSESTGDQDRPRRGSDARSILRVPSSLANDADVATRKSSATTNATVVPETAVSAAHFAIQRSSSTSDLGSFHRRPGSSGSLASVNLASALNRDPASGSMSSTVGSRWSSLRSFWSSGSRGDLSSDYSDVLQSTDEGLGISSISGQKTLHPRTPSKLEQMVQEAEQMQNASTRSSYDVVREQGGGDDRSPDIFHSEEDEEESRQRAIQSEPETSKQLDSPFKTSVNEKDGIIDVQIPFPDFSASPPSRYHLYPYQSDISRHNRRDSGNRNQQSSSFNSTASNSPSHGRPPSLALPHHASGVLDTTHPMNVAGWLTLYHADFALQAVQPYPNLFNDIKSSMSTEPTPPVAAMTPSLEHGPTDKWVDVCQCLIADTRNWTVRRISLRRLVRLVPVLGMPATTPGLTPGAAPVGMASRGAAERAATRTRHSFMDEQYLAGRLDGAASSIVMSEIHLKEEWHEEEVFDMDYILTDALEQVIDGKAVSGSHGLSAGSSRSSSRRGRTGAETAPAAEQPVAENTDATAQAEPDGSNSGPQAPPVGLAPREIQKAVTGALEHLVTSVVSELQTTGEDAAGQSEPATGNDTGRESALRAGIRKWMTEIDEGAQQVR